MSSPVLAVRIWKMVYGGKCGNCFFRYEGGGPGSIALCDKILIDHCSKCRIALDKPRQILAPGQEPTSNQRG